MKLYVFLAIFSETVLLFCSSAPSIPGFLEQYGYLQKSNAPGGQHSPKDMETALRSYQRFMKLPQSGQLDTATYALMQKPRCGFPDVIRKDNTLADHPQPSAITAKGRRARKKKEDKFPIAESFTAPRSKWNGKHVTWKARDYTRKLPRGSQRRAFVNAFRVWSDVIPLSIRETTGNADIEISFVTREHGDGRVNSFDDKGGTLAHAFFPGTSDINGDTHFDDAEDWTMTSSGTNLQIVAAHEFGHALGLSHSEDQSALMAPIYQYWENFKLPNDDVRAIQSLYGASGRTRTVEEPRTRPPRPPVTQRPTTTKRYCNLRFSSITEGHDRNVYVFHQKKVYKLDRNGGISRRFPKFVRDTYKMAPINSNAVAYSPWTRKTYFFKGNKLWRFTGFHRDRGYPKVLKDPNFPRKPSAALVWRDGSLFLFKGPNFYKWDPNTETVMSGYPKKSKHYWRGIPGNSDSAMTSFVDGYTYFFKFGRYFKYDAYRKRVVKGYPKPKKQAWLGCGDRIPR